MGRDTEFREGPSTSGRTSTATRGGTATATATATARDPRQSPKTAVAPAPDDLEPSGVAGHGFTEYRHHGCRCPVCCGIGVLLNDTRVGAQSLRTHPQPPVHMEPGAQLTKRGVDQVSLLGVAEPPLEGGGHLSCALPLPEPSWEQGGKRCIVGDQWSRFGRNHRLRLTRAERRPPRILGRRRFLCSVPGPLISHCTTRLLSQTNPS